MSRHFLQACVRYTRAGMHAWSEQSTCTFAALANLSNAALRLEHQGSPFSFKHSRTIKSLQEYQAMFTHHNRRDKLYHPVKF